LKRGEVWQAQLAPRSGAEQQGSRPVVVVSNDGFNRAPAWRSVIVVPLSTSAAQARRGPTAVGLPAGVGGLRADSTALCHQVTTLDRAKLTRRLGVLSTEWLGLVEEGLRAALDLE
jgi:mRNA interferase MazF